MPLKLSRNAKLLSPARMWEELQMNLADAIENHGQSKNVLEELSWTIPGDAYPSLDDLGQELGVRGAERGDEGTRADQPGTELQPERPAEPAQTPKPAVPGDRARADKSAIPTADIVTEDNIEALENRKEESGGVFVSYVPAKLKDARPHPANIVESGSMAATTPPKIRYKTKLPQETVSPASGSDGISGLQLEAVLYAGQSHSQTMPNGKRLGFFIGDGTGVGKGREMGAPWPTDQRTQMKPNARTHCSDYTDYNSRQK